MANADSRLAGHAAVDGAELYYEVFGAGPPVVFLHGNMVDRRMWRTQVDVFREHFTVILYDLRGYGRSTFPATPYSHHDDLLGLLDHLEMQAAHLVGASLGASVAVEFVLVNPRRTRSLTLVPGGLGGYSWSDELSDGFDRALAPLESGDVREVRDRILEFGPMRPAGRIPAVRAELETMIDDYGWGHFTADAPAERDLDPRAASRLAEIACPTLIVVGSQDVDDFRNLGSLMHARIRGARLVELNAGHLVNMEAPGPFNRALLDFLPGQG